ncbi:MAG: AAA family ATPase [bacterium]|nr:AAA family ATPase [bacterium]
MKNVLQELELQGFKSFAGKTTLEFPSRVTAIVGPNGSGKSNIIDAFRWVLGEREAKQLRGVSLDNLIFAGTPKRPAVGFAKVALKFDNRDRLFEQDDAEVVVARRIDRSGASEFSLNEGDMRLRDLVPLLARARLGSRGLTMVGQGQSDLFVRSSPQERREMIEEVLGLREFRLKKSQAERRLEASRINMDKVHAMLDELAPHLRLLRRQKHRWDKRSDIERELTDLERAFFAVRLRALDRSLHGVTVPLGELTKERTTKELIVRDLEVAVRAISASTADGDASRALRAELSKVLDERTNVGAALARLEAKLEFQASHLPTDQAGPPQGAEKKSYAEAIALLRTATAGLKQALAHGTIEEMRQAVAAVMERLDAFLAVRQPGADPSRSPRLRESEAGLGRAEVDQSLAAEIEALRKKLATLDADVARLRTAEEAVAKEREELQKSFRDQVERLEREKNDLRKLDHGIQDRLLEKERFQLQLSELEHEWRTLGRTLDELKTLPEPATPVDLTESEHRILRLRGELLAIGEIDEQVVKEATETEERHTFLSRELEDLTKAITDLQNLIRDLEHRIHEDFKKAFRSINEEFNNYFRLMFGGGKARMKLVVPKPKEQEETGSERPASAEVSAGRRETNGEGDGETPVAEAAPTEPQEDPELQAGIEVDLSLPRKRITSLDMLSGGEKSLVSIAALFALIAVSPPPFLVLDEIDAPLDEENAHRFAELVKNFASKTQFIIVTHNRATMEAADILYGITMSDAGVSEVLSLKLEQGT